MIYIKKLIIENFQSHKYTQLDFSNNLNVIVGPSDTGKTSIIRAIKWVLYNEPRGTGFIRKGENTCSVTLYFSNGYGVKRKRTAGTNQYIVIHPDGKETIFEGFGNNVPAEVINVHGIRKVEFDTGISSNINIAEQMEGPFMLSQPATLRAKALGRLVGAHIIDAAVKDIATDIHRLTQQKKGIEENISSIDQQLQQFKDLDDLKKVIEKSKGLLEDIEIKRNLLQRCIDINDNYAKATEQTIKIKNILHDLKDLGLVEGYVEGAMEKIRQVKRLQNALTKISTLDKEITRLQGMINKLTGLKNADCLLKSMERLCERLQRLYMYKKTMEGISVQITHNLKIQNKLQAVNYLDQKLNSLDTAIDRLRKIKQYSYKLNKLNRDEKESRQLADKLQHVTYVENTLSRIEKKQDLLQTYIKLEKRHREITNACQRGYNYLEQTKEEIKDMLNRYGNTIKSLGRCPLCNSTIDDGKVRHILKEIME
ncbi:MAG TPA: AAA family ATPase [Clostridiales bacterium]|nr:AAA family ATPase [Clostridiales bacterium]